MLGRLGLLTGAFRAYEAARALGRSARPTVADNGLPVPPRRLIVAVAGTPDVDWFLNSGRLAADAIADALARAGRPIETVESLLDFGCGCGRVIRYWSGLPADVSGTDRSPRLVEWCRRNLPYASFTTNELAPPLDYPDAAFDAVYSLSVFTHLPEELQRPWMDELRRVLRPGGLVVISAHGERYLERLDLDEKERFRAGQLVVRWPGAAGMNLCTAFHPREYVEGTLADGFELVDFVPEGAKGNPHQDLYVFRRR